MQAWVQMAMMAAQPVAVVRSRAVVRAAAMMAAQPVVVVRSRALVVVTAV